jgi:spore coat polysaccharide biosynthesis protein SpsF
MKTGAIIQARMSSERFPGKVLHTIAGKPMLAYLLESLRHSTKLSGIVVATSDHAADQPVADFCAAAGVACFRGSLHDVAGRFKDALAVYGFDVFLRVCADSPLLDWRLVDRAFEVFSLGNFDMVTNVLPRTYPRGQSVEVLRTDMFIAACPAMHEPEDREHVTSFFYKNPKHYTIHSIHLPDDHSFVRLCVDTADDMRVVSSMISQMEKPHWQHSLAELLELHCRVTCRMRDVA